MAKSILRVKKKKEKKKEEKRHPVPFLCLHIDEIIVMKWTEDYPGVTA